MPTKNLKHERSYTLLIFIVAFFTVVIMVFNLRGYFLNLKELYTIEAERDQLKHQLNACQKAEIELSSGLLNPRFCQDGKKPSVVRAPARNKGELLVGCCDTNGDCTDIVFCNFAGECYKD